MSSNASRNQGVQIVAAFEDRAIPLNSPADMDRSGQASRSANDGIRFLAEFADYVQPLNGVATGTLDAQNVLLAQHEQNVPKSEEGGLMRSIPGRGLWLGNAGDLRDARAVLAAGVAAVVELADGEPFAVLPRELTRCRFPLSDGGDNPPWLVRLAIECVAALLRAGVPVLVCCSAGMSRSVCVAAGGVALAEAKPLAESLAVVAGSGPADVSPALLVQLQLVLGNQASNAKSPPNQC
jgi:hypothetical protein